MSLTTDKLFIASFLHHEELYHSTPETQTDESYTHPEDLEHFAHHEQIEAVEDSRAQAFLEAESETHADLPHEAPPSTSGVKATSDKVIESKPPSVAARLGGVKLEAQDDRPYGEGEAGFARPRTEREKLRKGTPYKYKFRRGRKEF